MIWGLRWNRILFDHGFERGVILIQGEKIAAFQNTVSSGTKVIAAQWGIAALRLCLPAMWSEFKKRGSPPKQLVSWLSATLSKLAGLSHRKGLLKSFYDTDVVIWDPDSFFVLESVPLRFRLKISPYLGTPFDGQVKSVCLGGRIACHDGVIITVPRGSTL